MATQAKRPAAPPPTEQPSPQTEVPSSHSGRRPDGRFARGNRGGPGNPFARRVAELRCAFIGAVLPEDLQQIARRLITMAAMGDLAAAKLVVGYVLGKVPGPVDPDTLDQQECRLYQQNMSCTDIGEVVQHRPPADMAAGILRVSEIANAERGHQFAQTIREEDAKLAAAAERESEIPDTAEPAETLAAAEELVHREERTDDDPADRKRSKRPPSVRPRPQSATPASRNEHAAPAAPSPIGPNGPGDGRPEGKAPTANGQNRPPDTTAPPW